MLLSYLLIVLISYKFIPVIDLLYFVHLRSLQLSWFYSQNLYMLFSKRDLPYFIILNLVGIWEDIATELSAHPLQTILFSDLALEEELGVDERVPWEAQVDGHVDPEGDV